MMDFTNSSFTDFQQYVFFDRTWYDECTGSSESILRHCIRLFSESGSLLGRVPRDRLFAGFKFISSSDGFFSTPADPAVSWDLREGFFTSMILLFKNLFSIDSLHPIAFMWFEQMGIWSVDWERRSIFGEPRLRKAMLTTMQGILSLESRACRQAALHGLNHMHYEEAPAVEQIIDDFIANHPDIGEELRIYAMGCREGSEK